MMIHTNQRMSRKLMTGCELVAIAMASEMVLATMPWRMWGMRIDMHTDRRTNEENRSIAKSPSLSVVVAQQPSPCGAAQGQPSLPSSFASQLGELDTDESVPETVQDGSRDHPQSLSDPIREDREAAFPSSSPQSG